ncbi:MAG: HAD hydrolase-like protein [Clostridiales bacterium]|nr:HAD hydrolase-like protein [Clostridiales bacterium]
MQRFQTVLFDLDGTLTDSSSGILGTLKDTLRAYGMEPPPDARRFIGPPLRHCFAELLGEDLADEAVARYRARYIAEGLYQNEVYPGVYTLLERLRAEGLRLALATSKTITPTLKILEHFDLARFFDAVAGAPDGPARSTKQQVMEQAMAHFADLDRAATAMVGDRLHDMEGAAACGVAAVGVLWGFGSRGELARYRPVFLAETPAALADFLCVRPVAGA